MGALPSLFEVFFIIVLIIPGWLGWRVTRLLCPSKKKDFSAFDATIYCLAYTLPIVSSFSLVTGTQSIDALRDNIFNPYNYLILVILALLWGSVTAAGIRLFRKLKGEKPEPEPADEYDVKEASNLTEAKDLIAQGYEYTTEIGGKKLFKKRK